jgi:hypothetical protein
MKERHFARFADGAISVCASFFRADEKVGGKCR